MPLLFDFHQLNGTAEGQSDIDMAEEVWSFVSRYDLSGPRAN